MTRRLTAVQAPARAGRRRLPVTFDGRALAIVRPTAEGAIEVTVSAEGCEDVTITIDGVRNTVASATS
jgi:hypothetical protein